MCRTCNVLSVHGILSKARILVHLNLAVLVPAADLLQQLLLHGLHSGLWLDLDIDMRLLRQPRSYRAALSKHGSIIHRDLDRIIWNVKIYLDVGNGLLPHVEPDQLLILVELLRDLGEALLQRLNTNKNC